jgi:hypothetical protein
MNKPGCVGLTRYPGKPEGRRTWLGAGGVFDIVSHNRLSFGQAVISGDYRTILRTKP